MTTEAGKQRQEQQVSGATSGQFDERILAALGNPETYDHPVEAVELIQTHISWVFLAGDFVYKVKKPLDLGFLDFTSLPKRRHYCHEEVRLNGRLCPELYLGVVALREVNGTIRLGGERGRIVEYAVKMKRLPQERMLNHLLRAGGVETAVIDEIARLLAGFHERAETGPAIERYGSLRTVRYNWDENFEQTREFIGDTLTPLQYEFMQAWVAAWLRRNQGLLRRRQAEGRVRDGHGDLRASAVCVLDEGLCIFDCIEFNRRFRYADVAADVAFLAMDLTAKGHPDLSHHFVERYVAESGDTGLLDVVNFYICYRAWVRGKVESFRIVDPMVPEEEQREARTIAIDRFAQAVEVAAQERPPVLIITCGLSGSGKSAVANRLGLDVIASDRTRKELAGIDPTTPRPAAFQAGLYTPAFTQRTYRELLRRGRERLEAGESVILDATFSRRAWRQRARELAEECGAFFFCLECRVSDATARERLEARAGEPGQVSDATWETYIQQKDAFEAVDELEEWRHIVVWNEEELEQTVAEARNLLAERLAPPPPGDRGAFRMAGGL